MLTAVHTAERSASDPFIASILMTERKPSQLSYKSICARVCSLKKEMTTHFSRDEFELNFCNYGLFTLIYY